MNNNPPYPATPYPPGPYEAVNVANGSVIARLKANISDKIRQHGLTLNTINQLFAELYGEHIPQNSTLLSWFIVEISGHNPERLLGIHFTYTPPIGQE